MIVKHLQPSDQIEWDDYVLNHAQGPFYHLVGWKDIIEKSFGHQTFYLMARSTDKISGILPVVFIKSLVFGKIICSLPYLNFAGIIADPPEVEKILVEEAKKILQENHADYMEYWQHQKVTSLNHSQEHKVSMTVYLDSDPEK